MSSFGCYIKTEQEKRAWTQAEFGAKSEIASAISRIENGSQIFSRTKFKKSAELFGTNLQKPKDLFYADKLAKESFKYQCSDIAFRVEEETANYLKKTKTY